MLTIEALKAYGADTQKGLLRCMNDEAFYLDLVKKLMHDERFDGLRTSVTNVNLELALHQAHALSEMATSLALRPLAEQIDQMILCLQIQGDSAVLERQMRNIQTGLDTLRSIDATI